MEKEGFCIFHYADGSSYLGHFKNSRYDDYGIFFIRPKEIYEGEWKNGYPLYLDLIQPQDQTMLLNNYFDFMKK